MSQTYKFAKGETIVIGIRDRNNSVVVGNLKRAALKAAVKPGQVPPESDPELLVFTSSFTGDGWLLSGDSSNLPVGNYVADARFDFDSNIRIARHVSIQILPAVTGAA